MGCISHLAHKGGKVGAKCCTCALQSIQSTHNDGTLPSVVAKFGSEDGLYFLLDRCGDVCVQDVTGLYLQVIKCSKH